MSNEIIRTEGSQIAVSHENPFMALVSQAITNDIALDKLEKILELQRTWEADQARKAYVQAMADFKAEGIVIIKDKVNKQYNSRYSSIENLVNTVTPYLSKHGLSADWELDQTSAIRVTCVMTHRMGHSKRFPMTVPVDTSGAKNPLQQIKSSITYAKVTTFEAACGLASTEANCDDDGNGSGGKQANEMPEEQVVERLDAIASARNQEDLQRFYVAAKDAAAKYGDNKAISAFEKAKNTRYRQLHKEGLL